MKSQKSQYIIAYLGAPFKKRIDEIRGGYGIALVQGVVGPGSQYSISDKTGPRYVETGESGPVFTLALMETLPGPGDELLLEVDGTNKVVNWCFNRFWKDAQRRANGMQRAQERERVAGPLYRVVSSDSTLGHPDTAGKRFKQIFCGSLKALVAKSARDGLQVSSKDIFAPTHVAGPKTFVNRFEIRKDDAWLPCEDPRPLQRVVPVQPQALSEPEPNYRLMYFNHGEIGELAQGTARELNQKYPCGAKDPLLKLDDPKKCQFVFWEIYKGKHPYRPTMPEWTEVKDPRPASLMKKAAAPKEEAKQFAVTLTSLDQLHRALVSRR